MKFIKYVLLAFIVLIIFFTVLVNYNLRDRHPDFNIDISLKNNGQVSTISVGFAKMPITPDVTDTWNDLNGNAKYEPDKGDFYNDINGNNRFDPIWIGGFHNSRPAQGVHDDLWARVMVLDDGKTQLAIVSIDAVGFIYDDAVDIRKEVKKNIGCDYTIISSTHVHQAPDLIGIWGPSYFKSGVNKQYMQYVKKQTISAISTAVKI
jgi:hypothetical protein